MATCPSTGCTLSATHFGACVAHLTDDQVKTLVNTAGPPIDARGVTIDGKRAVALVRAARGADLTGATVTSEFEAVEATIPCLTLSGARFTARANFGGFQINGPTSLANATFEYAPIFEDIHFNGSFSAVSTHFLQGARFERAEFAEQAAFEHAVCLGSAKFAGTFHGGATFRKAQFTMPTRFDGAQFGDYELVLDGARFGELVSLDSIGTERLSGTDVVFGGDLSIAKATIGHALLEQCRFDGRVWLHGSTFGSLALDDGRFVDPGKMGDVVVEGTASLRDVVAENRWELRAQAGQIVLNRVEFRRGGRFSVRHSAASTRIEMDQISTAEPFTLVAIPQLDSDADQREGSIPAHVSVMRDVDLAQVTLVGLDLSSAPFDGVLNLDRARLDSRFARTPRVGGWTRRRIIAEERDWRLDRPRGDEWKRPECGPRNAELSDGHSETRPTELRIADLYRAMRKAREDAKDEPGAADFYYGEMEMRRHGTPDGGERAILNLYWLTAGYGLRASRALISLLVTILIFAGALYQWGLKDPEVSTALLQAINGAAFRAADTQKVNETGQFLQIPLRLLGPLFFGLALLSLRGRVKR